MTQNELFQEWNRIASKITAFNTLYPVVLNNKPYFAYQKSMKVIYLQKICKSQFGTWDLITLQWSLNHLDEIKKIGIIVITEEEKNQWVENHKQGMK